MSKERLVELIGNAPIGVNGITLLDKHELKVIEEVADYIIADGWIRPPCKVGDEIFMLVTKRSVSFDIKDHVMTKCKKQHTFTFIKQTRLMESNFFRVIKDIGKTVFLTREEAEAKLKKNESHQKV